MGPYGSVGAHIKTGRSPMARIILKPLLTKKWPIKIKEIPKNPGWGRAGIIKQIILDDIMLSPITDPTFVKIVTPNDF